MQKNHRSWKFIDFFKISTRNQEKLFVPHIIENFYKLEQYPLNLYQSHNSRITDKSRCKHLKLPDKPNDWTSKPCWKIIIYEKKLFRTIVFLLEVHNLIWWKIWKRTVDKIKLSYICSFVSTRTTKLRVESNLKVRYSGVRAALSTHSYQIFRLAECLLNTHVNLQMR